MRRRVTYWWPSLHFYWSGDGEREEELDYQGYCYCHNRGNCPEPSLKVSK